MEVAVAGVTRKSFDSPDEVRTPDKTRMEIFDLNGNRVVRMTAEPGWVWSECVGTTMGADSCGATHFGYCLGGRLRVTHEDGTEQEIEPGDIYRIEPGHDGRVVSDVPFVGIDFHPSASG